jgi:MOSC domain-containing protein YiiM
VGGGVAASAALSGRRGGAEPLHAHDIEIVSLLVSSRHRYEGRPADGPAPLNDGEVESAGWIDVRAHLGIVGDRYFGHAAHSSAAVTIMAIETLDDLAGELGIAHPFDPAAARRNIVVRGVDIDRLKGEPFSITSRGGTVLFQGHRAANPCAWMDVALAPGAHRALRGRGGIRCEPLTDGTLQLGRAVLHAAVDLARVGVA